MGAGHGLSAKPALFAGKPPPGDTKPVKDVKPLVAISKPPHIDTKMAASVHPGILKSPTLKKLHATGTPTNTMDPATVMMMGIVDQLTASMTQLANQVALLSTHPEAKPDAKPKVVLAPIPVPPKPAKAPEASGDRIKYYYGVGHGRDGTHGVYSSWGDTAPLVVGISKAIFQRFSTWDEAHDFVMATQALKKQHAEAQPSGLPLSDTWYAVTNSKTGFYEIFPSWPAARIHVVNISGASVRKLRTYAEAQSYVEGHASAWDLRPSEPAYEGRKPSQEEHQKPTPIPVQHAPLTYPSVPQPPTSVSTLYPPGKLMGVDPSTGKSEEVFNIDIEASEEELQEALCPPDLSEAMARSLINGTIDAVALPGGLNSGGELEGTSSDVGILGEALEELVTQNRGMAGRTGRSDLRWRSEKRTSVRSITTEDKLRTRIKQLKKLTPKIQKRMETLTSTSCKRSGWDDQIRIHTWSTYGYLPVLVMRSLRLYIDIHEHLLKLSTECGWSYITPELDYHVEEMELIRTLADSRIHAICGTPPRSNRNAILL
jgi:hypothetical protein